MPFFLVFVGLICVVTAARNTHAAMGSQLVKDFSGGQSFLMWAAAVGAVGALGYSQTLRPFSRAFLALIILAIILKHPTVFKSFVAAVKQGGVASPAASGQASSSSPSGGLNPAFDLGRQIQGAITGIFGSASNAPTAAQQNIDLGFNP